MRLLRPVFLLALVLGVAAADEAAAQKEKAKKHPGYHGKVLKVNRGKKDGHGSMTVKHHWHFSTKFDEKDVVEERTFKVTPATTFEKVEIFDEGKVLKLVEKCNFSHIHKGEHVIVHHKGNQATDVKIIVHKKK